MGGFKKRLRVYIQNVSVYARTTRTCVSTCARGVGAHGDVLSGHTAGRGSSPVLLTIICPRRVITWPQRSTKETRGSYPISVFLSPPPTTTTTHINHNNPQRQQQQHARTKTKTRTRTRTRTCTCKCFCKCKCICKLICVYVYLYEYVRVCAHVYVYDLPQ